MKYRLVIIILFLCNLCFSQNNKFITRKVKTANKIDTVFFKQLDSIVKERDLSIYRYIEIERNNYSQNSPKISILIRGFDTPMNNKLYQVKYKGMVYFF